jgi:ketosteroid isomerase-like protein
VIRPTTALLLATATLLAACSAGPLGKPGPNGAKIVDAIKTDEVHWNNDWQSGDAAKITAHYAPTAVVMMAGAPPLSGTAAIRPAIASLVGDAGHDFSFGSDVVDVAASGDLAVARGSYTEKRTDPKTGTVVTDKGAYVTVYRPGSNGLWKAIWNITAPGPSPNASATLSGASAKPPG